MLNVGLDSRAGVWSCFVRVVLLQSWLTSKSWIGILVISFLKYSYIYFTARGLSLADPTKVKARKSILFTEGFLNVENNIIESRIRVENLVTFQNPSLPFPVMMSMHVQTEKHQQPGSYWMWILVLISSIVNIQKLVCCFKTTYAWHYFEIITILCLKFSPR